MRLEGVKASTNVIDMRPAFETFPMVRDGLANQPVDHYLLATFACLVVVTVLMVIHAGVRWHNFRKDQRKWK